MGGVAAADADDGIEAERVCRWLARAVDPSVADVALTRLPGGYSSGAWRIDATIAGQATPMVLKAPGTPSMVYQRDAVREARIMDALHRHGAPVPVVIAIDEGTSAVGRPCFVMSFVDGRGVADATRAGYHDDAELREAGPDAQHAVWESFHDALGALHSIDAAKVPEASLGEGGVADVLAYWRAALLDVARSDSVPRHLAVLDWLQSHIPPGADDAPAVCLGDARLVNGLLDGTQVRALVDFEVAYVGNPAADIAYSLFFDDILRRQAAAPLALPPADDVWARWSAVTGRTVADREYWTAFAATILCVTATRAMIQWGSPPESVDAGNPLVPDWESAVERAAR